MAGGGVLSTSGGLDQHRFIFGQPNHLRMVLIFESNLSYAKMQSHTKMKVTASHIPQVIMLTTWMDGQWGALPIPLFTLWWGTRTYERRQHLHKFCSHFNMIEQLILISVNLDYIALMICWVLVESGFPWIVDVLWNNQHVSSLCQQFEGLTERRQEHVAACLITNLCLKILQLQS